MARNPSGLSFLHQKNSLGKFNNNPDFTDNFLDKIERQPHEGEIPPEGDLLISGFRGVGYTINRNGELKNPKGLIMKPFFHKKKRGPRVRIYKTKKTPEGDMVSYYGEVGIIQAMEKVFGPYFPGYSKKKEFPNSYILVPKDGNYMNMHYSNLHYILKGSDRGEKREIVKFLLTTTPEGENVTQNSILHVSDSYIRKIKDQLAKKGILPKYKSYQELQDQLGVQFFEQSVPIYQALTMTQGQLSNKEIVMILWPEARKKAKTNEEKRILTDKIVRVRKILTTKGLIPRFNSLFEEKKGEAIRMLEEKPVTGKTNKEIAEALGLKKEQIDNLARQQKKQGN